MDTRNNTNDEKSSVYSAAERNITPGCPKDSLAMAGNECKVRLIRTGCCSLLEPSRNRERGRGSPLSSRPMRIEVHQHTAPNIKIDIVPPKYPACLKQKGRLKMPMPLNRCRTFGGIMAPLANAVDLEDK
mmetsp:Transcript_26852/g.32952  ORF Transcript_26852/g.32952 Transcript_26852/m.32952 type:complete len:130 (+) Transcript_26852:384-773(+)